MCYQTRKSIIGLVVGVLVASNVSAETTSVHVPADPVSVKGGPCLQQLQQDGDSEAAWACVEASLKDADKELNRVYKETLNSVDPSWSLAEEYKEALRDAQRAWIAFRDADCTRIGVAARGDANLWIQSCYEYQTRKRIQELQAY